MADFVKFLDFSPSNIERLHHDYFYTTTRHGHKGIQKKVCFITYTFHIKYFKRISQKYTGKRILKINFKEALQENIYSKHNLFPKTQLQTTMNKRSSQKDKGKALAVQPKGIRKPSIKILDRHEGVSIETISIQDTLLAEAMYSCGEKSVILQKVFHTDLMFQDGEFTELPLHIKILLDNLQAAFRNLYSKRPLRLWNYILLAPVHSLKHLVVNSLARRKEIQAPQ